MDHDFVPKHEIVPVEEAQEILEEHGVEAKNLAKIFKSDLVVKEFMVFIYLKRYSFNYYSFYKVFFEWKINCWKELRHIIGLDLR